MTGTFSPELVGLSLIVAVAASYVAFALAAHISDSKGWAAAYWLAGGAVAMGTGIWSMHFVGMLAFKLPIAMSYNLETTVASLIIAVLVSGFALYIVSCRVLGPWTLGIGAITMGAGIALMHYTGMAAMEIAPPLTYDTWLVIASVAIAVAASALALGLTFLLRSEVLANVMWKRLFGAVAMGFGIGAMHYVGMAAAQFAPGTVCTAPGMQVDQKWLALAVAASTFLFLGTTMLILTIDVRLANQLDAANRRIAALAREDPLTGLANRRTFLDRLEAAYCARNRDKSELAVLFLDLDGFKDINDTLGHAAGDALLVEVAARLKRTVRRDDLVARFGGDEFAVLQNNIKSATDAGTLAEKIGQAIAEHYRIGHDNVAVTASIGIAQTTACAGGPADLMVQADLALYRAKDDGRNRYRFHNSDLDQQVHTRVLLARELLVAIERGELELLYQPQVQIATGRLVGLETHVRWNHPARGIIKPSVFIPIAERTGTIIAVGEWMLDEACRQLRQWKDHGLAPPVLAVDVSGGQFKAAANIVADLESCLEKHGVEARRIELELSESVLMHAAQRYSSTLEALRGLGLRICLNEFGDGYSSLRYLANAPVQRLKLPRSLVAGALRNEACARAVRASVQLGRELGSEIIADGVETQAQAMFLLAAGCEQGQGPFFAPLLSAPEATVLLGHAATEDDEADGRASSSSAA
ncbi:MAG: EAL domain-containing protein [Hyphomicrobium sp.]|jgi:diguanylate cyclase (GGDEF)-like protein